MRLYLITHALQSRANNLHISDKPEHEPYFPAQRRSFPHSSTSRSVFYTLYSAVIPSTYLIYFYLYFIYIYLYFNSILIKMVPSTATV